MAFDVLTYALCKKASGGGSGGSIPADYTQVKQAVIKNTQDIAELDTTINDETTGLAIQVETLSNEVKSLELDKVVKVDDLSKLIKVADKELTPAEDGSISIPLATTENAGVVRLASGENGVGVNAELELEVNSLSLDKLNQHDDDELVLKPE